MTSSPTPGATCGACGRPADAVQALDASLAEFFARVVGAAGPKLLDEGAACKDCERALTDLKDVDSRWNRLRNGFLARIASSRNHAIDPDADDDGHFAGADDDAEQLDSDDEPLYKLAKPVKAEIKEEMDCERALVKLEQSGIVVKKGKDAAVKAEPRDTVDRIILSSASNSKVQIKLNASQLKSSRLSRQAAAAAAAKPKKVTIPKHLSTMPLKVIKAIKVAPNAHEKIVERKREPKVMCTKCNIYFSSQTRLDQHIQVKHTAVATPYICEICGASYKYKKACDVHVAMHKGISPWKCNDCNKIFPSKGALSRHEAIHAGTLNYTCDLCGKSFIHTSSFKMHKLSHSGVKPHSCTKCGLSLMTKSHLKRHMRVHSGEKRHSCDVCGKKFSERYNLYAHQKSHDPNDVPRRLKNHDCSVCDATFHRRNLLDKHMETVHNCINESSPKKERNTMHKIMKQRVIEEVVISSGGGGENTFKSEPPAMVVEVKSSSSPPPLQALSARTGVVRRVVKMESNQYLSSSLTKANTPSVEIILPTTIEDGPSSAQGTAWLGNYHLANDYPLRMHGVDYTGYLNKH